MQKKKTPKKTFFFFYDGCETPRLMLNRALGWATYMMQMEASSQHGAPKPPHKAGAPLRHCPPHPLRRVAGTGPPTPGADQQDGALVCTGSANLQRKGPAWGASGSLPHSSPGQQYPAVTVNASWAGCAPTGSGMELAPTRLTRVGENTGGDRGACQPYPQPLGHREETP